MDYDDDDDESSTDYYMILYVPHSLSVFAPIVSFLFRLNAAALQKYKERTTQI